jgi:hypothetical protein
VRNVRCWYGSAGAARSGDQEGAACGRSFRGLVFSFQEEWCARGAFGGLGKEAVGYVAGGVGEFEELVVEAAELLE